MSHRGLNGTAAPGALPGTLPVLECCLTQAKET